jgi:hypothetical protein
MSEELREVNNRTPYNNMEFQYLVTAPDWGREIPAELWAKVSANRVKYVDGVKFVEKDALWELLGFYTKDVRLANLDFLELPYCKAWFDIAGHCLSQGYTKSFFHSLRMAITVLELSQSKKGFLRKLHITRNVSERVERIEPKDRGFFGAPRKDDGYNNGGMQ